MRRSRASECHVGEGARGWVESKAAGTRQLVEVMFNSYPRPIPSAMETDRLVPTHETCETCHWPEKFAATRLRVIPTFAEDEANTASQTVLMMMVGGSLARGIHGAHFGPGIEIQYSAADKKRQKIPWVEYRNTRRGKRAPILPRTANADTVKDLRRYQMQCVDCHNRPTHTLELPDRAIDNAMALGLLPATLPFLKKKSVELLKADYASNDEAAKRIPAELAAYYGGAYPAIASERAADVAAAATRLVSIYSTNVFPDLRSPGGCTRTTWATRRFPAASAATTKSTKPPTARPSRRTAGCATKPSPSRRAPRRCSRPLASTRESWPSGSRSPL